MKLQSDIKIPSSMFNDYAGLSLNAKVLYAILLHLDEMSEEEYISTRRDDIQGLLGVKHNTIVNAFKELREAKLITENSRGKDGNMTYISKN